MILSWKWRNRQSAYFGRQWGEREVGSRDNFGRAFGGRFWQLAIKGLRRLLFGCLCINDVCRWRPPHTHTHTTSSSGLARCFDTILKDKVRTQVHSVCHFPPRRRWKCLLAFIFRCESHVNGLLLHFGATAFSSGLFDPEIPFRIFGRSRITMPRTFFCFFLSNIYR